MHFFRVSVMTGFLSNRIYAIRPIRNRQLNRKQNLIDGDYLILLWRSCSPKVDRAPILSRAHQIIIIISNSIFSGSKLWWEIQIRQIIGRTSYTQQIKLILKRMTQRYTSINNPLSMNRRSLSVPLTAEYFRIIFILARDSSASQLSPLNSNFVLTRRWIPQFIYFNKSILNTILLFGRF